ncbi:hypothetical protein [Bdellovibrio svalbardensis]|uniref:Abnormal spindle-like microcephaly-associated protein ASH domain-containing protein n=1 Tax=Bdellovibrio svalbardensis TaxID=2972972 RepID=A0ABT6DLY7_9BACT|nr:hypothetical protein [Bdellovibrio svalbardensis]MDG0817614.1 hypothetical protein [Bdellovibrio svalbardensis]
MKALAALLMTGALSLFSQSTFAKSDFVLPMDATQGTIDFGELAVGYYDYDDIDVVAGNEDLTLDIALTGSDMFAIAHNCPATLAAGKTCHIFVIFEPTAEGDYTGEVSVNTSKGDYLFHLLGTGYFEEDEKH